MLAYTLLTPTVTVSINDSQKKCSSPIVAKVSETLAFYEKNRLQLCKKNYPKNKLTTTPLC